MANRRNKKPAEDHAQDKTADYERIRHYTLAEIEKLTDPNSPDYNPEEADRIRELQAIADNPLYDPERAAELKKAAAKISEQTAAQGKRIAAVIEQFVKEMAKVREEWSETGNPLLYIHEQDIQGLKAEYADILKQFEELHALEPYILRELDKPEWRDYGFFDYTLRELLIAAEEDKDKIGPAVILERAREAYKKALEAQGHKEPEQIENVQAHRVHKPIYQQAKLTHDVYFKGIPSTFGNPEYEKKAGDVTPETLSDENSFPLKMEKSNRPPVTLYYTPRYNMEFFQKFGIKPSQKNFYDLWVQFAVSNLYMAGNRKVSLNQIFNAMPGVKSDGGRAKNQTKAVKESCYRQLGTLIYANNKEMAEAWGLENYDTIAGPLLPINIKEKRATINGKPVDCYIEILSEPPLMKMASALGQIRTLPENLLSINIQRTNNSYGVLDYLIRQIEYMNSRTGARSNKILFKTMFEELQLTADKDKNTRTRCKKTAISILQQMRDMEYIKDFKQTAKGEADGVIVFTKK